MATLYARTAGGDWNTAAALTAYDPPTKTEMDSGLAALTDLDATGAQAACAAALTAYGTAKSTEVGIYSTEDAT